MTKRDEEYELLPHKEIEDLKREIEYLKKNPIGKGKAATNLMEGINSLNSSIVLLVDIFRGAAIELPKIDPTVTDEQSSSKVEELSDKVNLLMGQNKQIAEALVAITDMVKAEKKDIDEFKEKVNNPKPASNLFGNSQRPSTFGSPMGQTMKPGPFSPSPAPVQRPIPKVNVPSQSFNGFPNQSRPAPLPTPRQEPNFSNNAPKMNNHFDDPIAPMSSPKNSFPPGGIDNLPTPNPMPNYNPNKFSSDFDLPKMAQAPNRSQSQPEPRAPSMNNQGNISAPDFSSPMSEPSPFPSPEPESDIVSQIDADMHKPEPTGNIRPPPDMTPPLKVTPPTTKHKKGFFSI